MPQPPHVMPPVFERCQPQQPDVDGMFVVGDVKKNSSPAGPPTPKEGPKEVPRAETSWAPNSLCRHNARHLGSQIDGFPQPDLF